MDCNICFEDFDGEARIPKVLPCGHTVCAKCLVENWRRECPTCWTAFLSTPKSLPTNYVLLRLISSSSETGISGGWCSDCRAAAASLCRERPDRHEVLSTKAALSRHLPPGVLRRAADQLEGLQHQCPEETLLTLLTADNWDVTLRSGDRVLEGTISRSDDAAIKAMWLVLAARAAVAEVRPTAPPAPTEEASLPAPKIIPPPPAPKKVPPPVAKKPTTLARVPTTVTRRPTLDVEQISSTGHNQMRKEKEAAEERAAGVGRLVGVCCDEDPVWSLNLLRRAAPTLEQLSLFNPGKSHLRELYNMPRLRRLSLWSEDPLLLQGPQQGLLSVLPSDHAGLRWLRVAGAGLPRSTLRTLLTAHGRALQELWLDVGTPGSEFWPWSEDNLPGLLQACVLLALRRLVLRRWIGLAGSHNEQDCYQQRIAVQTALPGVAVQVLCTACDDVPSEVF